MRLKFFCWCDSWLFLTIRSHRYQWSKNVLLLYGVTLKEVDTVPYRLVWPEFFVPVDKPVPKHLTRYRPIPNNTGHTRVYRTFRPEKRNSAGTKTERKNRRNAWFEQTPVQHYDGMEALWCYAIKSP